MRARNLEFERAVTREAARGVADPEEMIERSEARSMRLCGEYVTDPMLVASRPRKREVGEELLDARNHAVWMIEEAIGVDDDEAQRGLRVLRLLVMAYGELIKED